MKDRLAALTFLAVAWGSPISTAAITSAELRTQVIQHLAANHADSALALIREERFATTGVVEALLRESVAARVSGSADSADVALTHAKTIAELAFRAFADSLTLREVRFHEALSPDRVKAVSLGWSNLAKARELYDAGRQGDAAAMLGDLDASVAAAGDPFLSIRAAHEAGRCLRGVGNIEGARARMEIARTRAHETGDGIAEERANATLGMLLLDQDRTLEATDAIRAVLGSARDLGDHEMVVWAHMMLGNCHRLRGDFPSARDEYEDGLALAKTRAMNSSQVSLLVNLGALRDQMGDGEGALADLENALRLGRESGTLARRTELNASLMMASILMRFGRYSQALALQRDALDAASKAGIADLEAVFRTQIGETYLALGRPEDAIPHFEKAVESFRAARVPRHVGVALKDLAQSEAELGRDHDAIRRLEEALAVIKGQEVPSLHAELLASLGRLQVRAGESAAAESTLLKARAVAESSGNPFLIGDAERAFAGMLAERGSAGEALALLEKVVERGRRYRSQSLLVDALSQRARLLREEGRNREANEHLTEAIALVEEIRGRQSGEAMRAGVLAARASIFSDRVAVLYELGAAEGGSKLHEEAFRVAEAGRARALVDALCGQHIEVEEGKLREREREISAQLAGMQTALSRAASAENWSEATADSLEALVGKTGREYRELLDEIGARDHSHGALVGSRSPLSIDEARARVLRGNQILLEYVVGEKESFVFLVSQKDFRLARLEVGQERLTSLIDSLRASTPATSTSTARELYRLLLEPIAAQIPSGARLLISPDGPLLHLPFSLLHDGERFLVERDAIAYAPSAGSLDRELRGRRRSRSLSVLAVGNPTTYREDALLARQRDASRWAFAPLPYAEEEARRVASRFRNSTVLTGDQASEESVKSRAGRASHLHFATHGILNEREPMLSGILLAQDNDPAEDGILQAHEVLAMKIPADLVTLSACETGRGRILRGEGVLGLTNAFLHAGAHGLMLSLWVISDRSTMGLMQAFYDSYLSERAAPDVALQKAQISAIHAGHPPQEWAGFLFVGEADPIPQRNSFAWLLAFGLILGASILFIAYKRRNVAV